MELFNIDVIRITEECRTFEIIAESREKAEADILAQLQDGDPDEYESGWSLENTDYKVLDSNRVNIPPHEYDVSWRVKVFANSPEEAAQKAREIQLDDQSCATIFDIADEDGGQFEIDLLDTAREENAGTSPHDLLYLIDAHVKAKGRIDLCDPDGEPFDLLPSGLVFRPRCADIEVMPYALYTYKNRDGGREVNLHVVPADRREIAPVVGLYDLPPSALFVLHKFLIDKKL